MESLKIEITSASLKVEERQAVGSLKIERLDQSVEYPEVEDKESPKVERGGASPTTEENKESYQIEDNKNSEALEIGRSDSQCPLKPIQSENVSTRIQSSSKLRGETAQGRSQERAHGELCEVAILFLLAQPRCSRRNRTSIMQTLLEWNWDHQPAMSKRPAQTVVLCVDFMRF
jgi:hypothetical protein